MKIKMPIAHSLPRLRGQGPGLSGKLINACGGALHLALPENENLHFPWLNRRYSVYLKD